MRAYLVLAVLLLAGCNRGPTYLEIDQAIRARSTPLEIMPYRLPNWPDREQLYAVTLSDGTRCVVSYNALDCNWDRE